MATERRGANAFANTVLQQPACCRVTYATGSALIALSRHWRPDGSVRSPARSAKHGPPHDWPRSGLSHPEPLGPFRARARRRLLGALALGALGVALGLLQAAALVPVIAGATIGSFAESAMGSTLEGPGFVNNDVLNFLNTAIAAAAAVVLAKAFE